MNTHSETRKAAWAKIADAAWRLAGKPNNPHRFHRRSVGASEGHNSPRKARSGGLWFLPCLDCGRAIIGDGSEVGGTATEKPCEF